MIFGFPLHLLNAKIRTMDQYLIWTLWFIVTMKLVKFDLCKVKSNNAAVNVFLFFLFFTKGKLIWTIHLKTWLRGLHTSATLWVCKIIIEIFFIMPITKKPDLNKACVICLAAELKKQTLNISYFILLIIQISQFLSVIQPWIFKSRINQLETWRETFGVFFSLTSFNASYCTI